ncbi:unnamed protein product, partial [Nesidiocoris tenuis]
MGFRRRCIRSSLSITPLLNTRSSNSGELSLRSRRSREQRKNFCIGILTRILHHPIVSQEFANYRRSRKLNSTTNCTIRIT